MTTAFVKSVREHVVGAVKRPTLFRSHQRTIDGGEHLLAYSEALSALRKRKATAKQPSMRLEASVVQRARVARDAGRNLFADGLSNLQKLRETDLPRALFASVAAAGKVDLAAELHATLADAKTKVALQQAGISPGLLAAVEAVVSQAKVAVTANGAAITATVPGQPRLDIELAEERLLRPDSKSHEGPSSLLRQPIFDTIVEGFASGSLPSSVPLRGRVPKQRESVQIDLFDAAAVGALISHTELEAHLRRLECGGLNTHLGSEGAVEALIAVLIVGFILIGVGAIITGIGEIAGDDGVVAAGMVVMGIGMILIGVSGGVLVGMFDPFAGVAVLVAGVAFGGATIAAPFI